MLSLSAVDSSRSRQSEEGFSLVEALIASGILIAGVASAVQLFLLAASSTQAAGARTQATIQAAQKAEQLRAAAWEDVVSGEDTAGSFIRRWTVTPLPEDPEGTVAVYVVVEKRELGPAARVTLAWLRTREAP